MCFCMFLYLRGCLYISFSVCVSFSFCIYVCVGVCMSSCFSDCLCVCLHVTLPFLSISFCVCDSLIFYICMSSCFSACLSLCVSLSVCLCVTEDSHPIDFRRQSALRAHVRASSASRARSLLLGRVWARCSVFGALAEGRQKGDDEEMTAVRDARGCSTTAPSAVGVCKSE